MGRASRDLIGPGRRLAPPASPRSSPPPAPHTTRVLDQSRRYIEDFDQAVAKSSTPRKVIDVMLAKYPAYGNRYTLFVAAFTQFPS